MCFINYCKKENKEARKRLEENSKEVERLHNDFKKACG